MRKIVTILGARPQFVKAAVLSRVIRRHRLLEEVIVHTGQHFDKNMSDVFFEEMQIPHPRYNLAINGLGHGAMTGQMLEKIEEVLLVETPALVIVYGDTNSTLAGALAARKLHIPVAHVEAGLRSFNMRMPEETNRILTDRISDLLFCPTQTAMDNLQQEGFDHFKAEVVLSGDIMKDAVEFYSEHIPAEENIVSKLRLKSDDFVLATIHRQENTDDEDILEAIFNSLGKIHRDCEVVAPLHPRTAKAIEQFGILTDVTVIDPVGYLEMLQLLQHCKIVVTDSGGLQKEAFFSKRPCLVVRPQTEWVELVQYGFARLTSAKNLYDEFSKGFEPLDHSIDLFGNQVGERIHQQLVSFLEATSSDEA